MPQLVPAILEETREKFEQKVSLLIKIPGVDRIQVDFGDGIFIPTVLLPPSEIDTLNPALHWEAHLMVKEPADFLDYRICGFTTIIVHFEAYHSVDALKNALKQIRQHGMEPAVALNPDTPVDVLTVLQDMTKYFQIMGVVPGRQGQSFIPAALERIAELRRLIPSAIIEVDGGVNINNIKTVAEAGADLIVAGSAVVASVNPAESFEKLKQIVNKNQ